ncbi:mobilization protein [Bacteroidia bacterium]|nr:mobilization protein [Bacteroidia bacterium]
MQAIKKQHKNGRPTKEAAERKKYKVSVKMATEEYYSLKSKARLAGLSRSEYIRQCIRSSEVKQRLSSEQLGYIRQLSGMANNINQIARKANTVGYLEVCTEWMNTVPEIDKTLKLIEK